MADTYTLISSVTVPVGGASSIDFTIIPSTYTDLHLVFSARCSVAAVNSGVDISLNGSTSSFSFIQLYGTGSSAGSTSAATNDGGGGANGSTSTASTFASSSIYLPNYAGNTNKSYSVEYVVENNATATSTTLQAGLWSNTSAINQITLTPNAGTFDQYSTAYLYGIKNS